MQSVALPNKDVELLRRAMVLLDYVGHSAPTAEATAAIECLAAADLLAQFVDPAGGSISDLTSADVQLAVEEALRLLGELSPATFNLEPVSDAVDAAQRAYAAATRP